MSLRVRASDVRFALVRADVRFALSMYGSRFTVGRDCREWEITWVG
jgi:hypothetical protein